jgi:hypothetical protein
MAERHFAEGGCTCRTVRYRLKRKPMFVHCCHCTWCQRDSGTAFALNALIEASEVELLSGKLEAVDTPTESGKGQIFMRCPTCLATMYSHYAGAGPSVAFVRVGTLDDPGKLPPDVHIFTRSKLPWVKLPEGALVMEEFYSYRDHWPEESFARLKAAKQG